MVKRNSGSGPRLVVTGDGTGVAAHAGSRLLADMADVVGLSDGLSAAMASTRRRRSAHDPGRVLVDLAVMAADGGTSLSDLRVLRDQPELFGQVASDPTAWRVLDSIDAAVLAAIEEARAEARAAAWAAGARPPVDFIVLDFDATLVTSHSDKADAAPNYKHGFGFHPLLCFVDATNDAVAGVLRPGNAGSNTAADHIAVLDAALAQLPVKTAKVDPEGGEWMLRPEPTRPAPPTTSSRRCGTGDSSSPSKLPHGRSGPPSRVGPAQNGLERGHPPRLRCAGGR